MNGSNCHCVFLHVLFRCGHGNFLASLLVAWQLGSDNKILVLRWNVLIIKVWSCLLVDFVTFVWLSPKIHIKPTFKEEVRFIKLSKVKWVDASYIKVYENLVFRGWVMMTLSVFLEFITNCVSGYVDISSLRCVFVSSSNCFRALWLISGPWFDICAI